MLKIHEYVEKFYRERFTDSKHFLMRFKHHIRMEMVMWSRSCLIYFLVSWVVLFSPALCHADSFEIEMDQALAIACKLEKTLNMYILVHDEMFKVSLNRMLPIEGFFEAINFASCTSQLEIVCRDLEEKMQEMAKIQFTNKTSKKILEKLKEYSLSLIETVTQLKSISEKMQKKTISLDSYDSKTFYADSENYQKSIASYTKIGEELSSYFAGN